MPVVNESRRSNRSCKPAISNRAAVAVGRRRIGSSALPTENWIGRNRAWSIRLRILSATRPWEAPDRVKRLERLVEHCDENGPHPPCRAKQRGRREPTDRPAIETAPKHHARQETSQVRISRSGNCEGGSFQHGLTKPTPTRISGQRDLPLQGTSCSRPKKPVIRCHIQFCGRGRPPASRSEDGVESPAGRGRRHMNSLISN